MSGPVETSLPGMLTFDAPELPLTYLRVHGSRAASSHDKIPKPVAQDRCREAQDSTAILLTWSFRGEGAAGEVLPGARLSRTSTGFDGVHVKRSPRIVRR